MMNYGKVISSQVMVVWYDKDIALDELRKFVMSKVEAEQLCSCCRRYFIANWRCSGANGCCIARISTKIEYY